MRNSDEHFADNIRAYHFERLGIKYYERDYGFVGYSIRDVGTERHLFIDEWYAREGSGFHKALRLVMAVLEIGKQQGCTHLIGCNETTLPSYERIKILHSWFKMHYVETNGTQEIWARNI